jgi:hypothetical protein
MFFSFRKSNLPTHNVPLTPFSGDNPDVCECRAHPESQVTEEDNVRPMRRRARLSSSRHRSSKPTNGFSQSLPFSSGKHVDKEVVVVARGLGCEVTSGTAASPPELKSELYDDRLTRHHQIAQQRALPADLSTATEIGTARESSMHSSQFKESTCRRDAQKPPAIAKLSQMGGKGWKVKKGA